jgi:hypothetical protein
VITYTDAELHADGYADVRDDLTGNWYEVRIQEIKNDMIFIHYNGWSTEYDEWIPLSDEVLPAHTKSRGPNLTKRM